MEKIKKLIKKFCTKEVILYLVFGVTTTLINWGAFWILNSLCHLPDNGANIIAIIIAVLFAYVTNKDLVFHSEAKSLGEKLAEFGKFMASRAFTMVLEFGLDALLFLTPIPKMVTKFVVTVIVVIINYFLSKFFAFKKKDKGENDGKEVSKSSSK